MKEFKIPVETVSEVSQKSNVTYVKRRANLKKESA